MIQSHVGMLIRSQVEQVVHEHIDASITIIIKLFFKYLSVVTQMPYFFWKNLIL